MAHSVAEIAKAIGAEAAGDLSLTVTHASEPAMAGPDALALAMDPKYAPGLTKGQARVAMLWPGADWQGMGLKAAIFAPRGRLAMAGLSRMLDPGPQIAPGVHPMSVIDPTAKLGEGAAIGPFVTIGAGAVIGARARIASHVSIAEGARIGEDALICQGARIGARVDADMAIVTEALFGDARAQPAITEMPNLPPFVRRAMNPARGGGLHPLLA